MAFRPRGGRVNEYTPIFHKGRRPRRTIKSAKAKAGVRRLPDPRRRRWPDDRLLRLVLSRHVSRHVTPARACGAIDA
jgi:hypothetical protein